MIRRALRGLLRRPRRTILLAFLLLVATSCVRPRTEGLLPPPPGTYRTAETGVALPGSEAGAPLEGYLVRPAGRGPFPCAVLLHGRGGWWQAYTRYARELARRGVAALIVNYYSVHTVDLEGLTTPFRERRAQFEAQNADIARAAAYFARRPFCRGRTVGLVGFSLGADKAFRTAARLPEVSAVVAYYGPYDYVSFIKKRISPLLLALASEDLLRWKRYLETRSPIRQAGKTRAAALLFHGVQDGLIPLQQTFAMARRLRQRPEGETRLRLYEGVGHNFVLRRGSRQERDDSLRLTVEFLQRNLAPPARAVRTPRRPPPAPRAEG